MARTQRRAASLAPIRAAGGLLGSATSAHLTTSITGPARRPWSMGERSGAPAPVHALVRHHRPRTDHPSVNGAAMPSMLAWLRVRR